MTTEHTAPKGDESPALTLRLHSATQQVSSLSSLLRTLQAALRESALSTREGTERFAEPPQPVLLTSVITPPGRDALELRFFFAQPRSSRVEPELTAAAAGAFLDTLEQTLKAQPQRTLWDVSSRPRRGGGTGPAPSPRIGQLWEDLGRFATVTVSAGGRRITVTGGSVEITEE